MTKIIHIIPRLDMGGSAQNTLLTCQKLSCKYQMLLAHGLSLESKMTDSEKQSVDAGLESARENGIPNSIHCANEISGKQRGAHLVR